MDKSVCCSCCVLQPVPCWRKQLCWEPSLTPHQFLSFLLCFLSQLPFPCLPMEGRGKKGAGQGKRRLCGFEAGFQHRCSCSMGKEWLWGTTCPWISREAAGGVNGGLAVTRGAKDEGQDACLPAPTFATSYSLSLLCPPSASPYTCPLMSAFLITCLAAAVFLPQQWRDKFKMTLPNNYLLDTEKYNTFIIFHV